MRCVSHGLPLCWPISRDTSVPVRVHANRPRPPLPGEMLASRLISRRDRRPRAGGRRSLASGQRTSPTQRSFSINLMTMALVSISSRRTPCRAEVGLGVVEVVPRLAHGRQRQPPHVLAAVPGLERTPTVDVAHRVDGEGDVVQQGDPDQAAPEERGQGAPPRPRPQPADEGRDQASTRATQSGNDPRHPADDPVGQQLGGVAALRGLLPVEEPAEMGVEEALGQGPGAVAVAPGRMRVAVAVGEAVVLAVVGHPLDDRTLDGHAAGDGQRSPAAIAGPGRPGG